MMTIVSARYIALAMTTALGLRSTNTIWRSFPGVSTSTMMKPTTRTPMPTRKYRIVATTPLRTGFRSMFPISTARYMVASSFGWGLGLFGSAGPAGRSAGAARGGSGAEAGAEEDERAVAVSGAERLDADAAGVAAVGADDHDVVAVAQVFAVAAGRARLRLLVVGQRVGHVARRAGALVA